MHIVNLFLLIEPVWNRNSLKSPLGNWRICRLLIEPVWNRNCRDPIGLRCGVGAFNRTSLESKLWSLTRDSVRAVTFNRTSLESKLGTTTQHGCQVRLLIEPVWNRNTSFPSRSWCYGVTFNRTSLESKPILSSVHWVSAQSFNRTSLESKLFARFTVDGLTPSFNRTSLESKHDVDLLGGKRWSFF